MKNKNDIYEQEVKRLTENPELIRESWNKAEPLFKMVNSERHDDSHLLTCGCLTQIKGLGDKAYKDGKEDLELTRKIKEDERLPGRAARITAEHLPVFAEWQRRIDHYFKTGELK